MWHITAIAVKENQSLENKESRTIGFVNFIFQYQVYGESAGRFPSISYCPVTNVISRPPNHIKGVKCPSLTILSWL